MSNEIPTFGGSEESLEERIKSFEQEKKGLIADLQKQREEKRQLEERLSQVEASLNEPDPSPVQDRIQAFTQDPDAYISDIVEERISQVEKRLTMKDVSDQISEALEEIADREGISKREAKKKYDSPLAEIVKSRSLGNIAPYDGILNAYDLYQQEAKDKEAREEERNRKIIGQSSESVRIAPNTRIRIPTPDEISRMSSEEYEKHRAEILTAQSNGAYVKK